MFGTRTYYYHYDVSIVSGDGHTFCSISLDIMRETNARNTIHNIINV